MIDKFQNDEDLNKSVELDCKSNFSEEVVPVEVKDLDEFFEVDSSEKSKESPVAVIEDIESKDKINVEPIKIDRSEQEASSLITKEENEPVDLKNSVMWDDEKAEEVKAEEV